MEETQIPLRPKEVPSPPAGNCIHSFSQSSARPVQRCKAAKAARQAKPLFYGEELSHCPERPDVRNAILLDRRLPAEAPDVTSKPKISRELQHMDRSTVQRFFDGVRAGR